MEKQVGWAHNLGRVEHLWISKLGHTHLVNQVDGVSDMAPAYWLCGGELNKGTTASACPDARHFSFSLYTTGAL